MSSDSFRDILERLDKSLIPSRRYYSAHRRGEPDNLEFEFLEDHSALCTKYFIHLVEKQGIEAIIDRNLESVFGEQAGRVKEIILYCVYYHDVGKLNPEFQKSRVNNIELTENTEHSIFSKIVLISFLQKQFADESLAIPIGLFVYLVERHHTALDNSVAKMDDLDSSMKRIIEGILSSLLLACRETTKAKWDAFFSSEDEPLFFRLFNLMRLVYALLVMSDSFSTFHFSNRLESLYRINRIDGKTREKMMKSFFSVKYNKVIENPPSVMEDDPETINDLRRILLQEADRNMKRLLKQGHRVFMMNAPTGSGKTNISIKLALDVLEHDGAVQRLFFVFPYINIIEQNYRVIEKTLFTGITERVGLVSDIHSRSFFNKDMPTENTMDQNTLRMTMVQNDNFLNNCANVITNVNFLEGMVKNRGDNRYKIANYCNSVVIIDEIQTLPDKHIRTLYSLINATAKDLNIYYIIMSATLPNLNYFIDDANIPYVLSPTNNHMQSTILKRNTVVFRDDVRDIEGIKQILKEEIRSNYGESPVRILVTMNTVKTSMDVFSSLRTDDAFSGFKFLLLNSTISSPRRKKIIEEIKWTSNNAARLIIVSTQSIEAGMDIDCDFGIRDFAPLDSIDQISGRINRECDAKKAGLSRLYIIRYQYEERFDSDRIYRAQERYKLIHRSMNHSNIEQIVREKDFDSYYRELAKEIKKLSTKESYRSFCRKILELHFEDVDKEIDVIEDDIEKIDIFFCGRIPLDSLTKNDIELMRSIIDRDEIRPYHQDAPIIDGSVLDSSNILRCWKRIILTTDRFRDVYVRRMISSLVNQFTISITNFRSSGHDLGDFLTCNGLMKTDENLHFAYSTSEFGKYYSFEQGLDVARLKEDLKQSSAFVII
jgi:CRISPR-associated endonuclease/helicase Cas3